jgi:predicted DNA-binding transcriptional regulator AlpA
MKLLDHDALREEKGIQFSKVHLRRLVARGEFPAPMKVGRRDHWVDEVIDRHIADMLQAQRKTATA